MSALMIFADRISFWRAFAFTLMCLSACGDKAAIDPNPRIVFPDAEPLAHRHRNHSMTESPDGQYRVYAAQRGDYTDLMLMRRLENDQWSEPELLNLPRLESNTTPRFFPDGTLYYSSDARHPDRPGRKDLNIWKVKLTDGVPSEPEVLPDEINTGSSEDGFAPLGPNKAVFASTTLGGVGGFDLYIAEWSDGEWHVTPFPHNTLMADNQPLTARDGKILIWYAHLPTDQVYGVVDLFVSRYDEKAGWSLPENLGPIVNTAGIDYGAGISGDEERLFFSTDGILYDVNLDYVLSNSGFAPSQ